MTNKKWKELVLYLPKENWPKVEIELTKRGIISYELIDTEATVSDEDLETWLYFDSSIFDGEYPGITLKAYRELGEEAPLTETLEFVEENLLGSGKMSVIDDSDWGNNWKDYYHIQEIGESIVIKPEWEEYDNLENKIVIEITPQMAFGTGGHESTRLALINLEKYLNNDDSLLDVGTGSGILAVAGGLLGANDILGTDIDEYSIEISRENADKNGVKAEFKVNDLLENIDKKFDLVVANIVAEIIDMMLPDMEQVLKKTGTFIGSGITLGKVDALEESLNKFGLYIVEKQVENDWVSIVARYKDV